MPGIMSKKEREEYLKKLRQKLHDGKKGSVRRDPYEFRTPRAKDGEALNFYFRVLPELGEGEKCESGTSTMGYDYPFYEQGAHWINNSPTQCPRIHDKEECAICQLGFDLMSETTDSQKRSRIARMYLSRSYYAINIYFLDNKRNPEDIRGKVMWMSIPQTVYTIFENCLHSDDPGDSDDPKAHGLFYDPMEGYVFKLNVKKKGEWNTYEGSTFLPNTLGPIIEGDEDTIQEILDQRHDLSTKFDPRDQDKIKAVVKKLVDGDDDEDDDDDDDDLEETTSKSKSKSNDDDLEEKPKKSKKAKKAKAKVKKEPEPEEEDDPLDADDDEDGEELADLLTKLEEDDE